MSRRRTLEPAAPPLSPIPSQPQPLGLVWKITAALILLAYAALGAGHIYTTPVAPSPEFNYINAPDEAAHIMYVRSVAVGGRLPVRGNRDFPTYEWHQPPLYYWIISTLFRFGPIALRWGSLIMGAAALVVIFLGARLAAPNDPPLAVLAFGFAALLPMRQATTSAVGNDVLIELIFSAAIVSMIVAFRSGLTIHRAALIGMLLGAALLTKATGLLLVVAILAGFFLLWRAGEDRRSILTGGLIVFGLGATLTVGWFARNIHLYHELTPAKAFLQEFEGTKKASDIIRGDFTRTDYLRVVSEMTFQSFWAAYTPHAKAAREGTFPDTITLRQQEFYARNGIPMFMPAPFYVPYGVICTICLVGLIRMCVRRGAAAIQWSTSVLALLTLVLVLAAFVAFVWTFFQTQGRYLYPALLPISLFIAAGYREIVGPRYRDAATYLALGLFAALALVFLFAGIQPAYS